MENEKQSNLVPASSFAANHPELFQKSKRDDAAMHDQAFETKPISYFRGAMMRFAKNKASIVAAVIIFIIILYAIIVPFASPKAHVDSVTYPNGFQDPYFSYALPYNSLFKGTGFWDGTETKNGISDRAYDIYRFDDSNHSPIAQDYGTEPRLVGTTMQMTHNIRVDSYAVGNKVITVNAATYQKIVSYEQEKGIYHTSKGIMKPLVYYTDNYYNDDGTKNDNPGYCAQYRDIMAQDLAGVNYNELTTAQTDIQMQINNVVDAMQNYYNQNSSIFYKLDAKVTRLSGTVYTQNSFSAIKTASDQPIEIYQKDSNGSYVYDREFHDDYTIRVDYFDYFTLIHGFEPHYFFGANASGQDIFLRLAQGARFSLLLGVGISLINILIGVIWGSISGYYGGTTDLIMERVTDIISGIPSIIILTVCSIQFTNNIALRQAIGTSGIYILAFLVAFVYSGWIGVAGTTRMQFYRFKGQENVLVSRTLGAKDRRLIFKHILPNAIGTLVTSSVLMIPSVIFSESSLSYLGIINFTTSGLCSIGSLLNEGQAAGLKDHPHMLLFPCLVIALLMICFNLFGNGLRDAFNPSLRGSDN